MSPSRQRFRIEGRELAYPTQFRDGSSVMAMFPVNYEAADSLISGSGLRPARLLPGHAVLSLNCVHYIDTDCGAYEEVALAILVADPCRPNRTRGSAWLPDPVAIRDLLAGGIGAHSWRLGVSTTLARDCGIRMWGFPKVRGDLSWVRMHRHARMTWVQDGEPVLDFTAPAGGGRRSSQISAPVYSIHNGELHVGRLAQSLSGVGYHPRGGRLELGTHGFADELRALGIARKPLLSVWSEHLRFEMSEPKPLRSGAGSAQVRNSP